MHHGMRFSTRRGKTDYTLSELEALAAREPERFSPNVLLSAGDRERVAAEVAYLGGPGQLRYLPVTSPVYERLGVTPQPHRSRRWSGIILDSPGPRSGPREVRGQAQELMQPPRSARGPAGTIAAAGRRTAGSGGPLRRADRSRLRRRSARAAVDDRSYLEKPVAGREKSCARRHPRRRKEAPPQHVKKRAEETELSQIARPPGPRCGPHGEAAGAGAHPGALFPRPAMAPSLIEQPGFRHACGCGRRRVPLRGPLDPA